MGKKHIHKYHEVTVAAQKVWACALDDCSHYMPAHLKELMPSKGSICWGCGNKFILTEDNMTRARPICTKCDLKERGINLDIDSIDDLITAVSKAAKENQTEEK